MTKFRVFGIFFHKTFCLKIIKLQCRNKKKELNTSELRLLTSASLYNTYTNLPHSKYMLMKYRF